MALQPDIQYISFYMDGSAAKQLERRVMQKVAEAPKPKYRKAKRRVIGIDPIAIAGVAAAVVMLCAMLVGLGQYESYLESSAQMRAYIEQLQQENAQLQKTYEEGYDLEQIREIAEAVGMVPAESVEHYEIHVQLPEAPAEPEPTFWESAAAFLAGLFA